MIIQPGIAKANLGLSREDVTMEDHVSIVSFVVSVSFFINHHHHLKNKTNVNIAKITNMD